MRDLARFFSEVLKLSSMKLTNITQNVFDEVKNICKLETMTMTNNCCPNKGLLEA